MSSDIAQKKPSQGVGFYLRLSVYWFSLSLLWGGMITFVIQTIIHNISPDKKDLYLGWTLAGGALVSTLVGLVIGTISDRSHWKLGRRRPYIIIGTLFTIPCLLWLAVIGSTASSLSLLPVLILDFCLIQFWINIATSPYQALVPDLVPRERQGTASAYMGMGSLLGQLGGLLLCGFLIGQKNGLWIICITLSTVLFLAMLYTALTIKEVSAENNPAPRTSFWQAVAASFQVQPKEHPDFFRLIFSRFVINMGFYTATEFLLYYAKDTLLSPNASGTVLQITVIATFSGLIGNFPAGIYADRISKKRIVYISTTLTGIAVLAFLLTSSIPLALLFAFFFGGGFGAFQAVDWALATNLLPDFDEAKFMGIWHAAFTVPQVIAPLIGGSLAYLFNEGAMKAAVAGYGPGFGYRIVFCLVLFYLIVGTLLIRPVQERVQTAQEG
jgi:MFS family permease